MPSVRLKSHEASNAAADVPGQKAQEEAWGVPVMAVGVVVADEFGGVGDSAVWLWW